MRHRLQQKVFDRKKYNTDKSVLSSSIQESRTPSTFTTSYNGKNPHLTKNKLHSKSTYFYRWGSSSKLSSSLSYVVPGVCALALLIGGIITISPILNENDRVYADEVIDNPKGCSTSNPSGVACIKLVVTPDVGSTNGAVQAGTPAYFSNTVNVGGNHISEYSLTLNTAAGSNGELVGESNPYATVGKVDIGTAYTALPDNTWGYGFGSTTQTPQQLTYNPVPAGDNNSAMLTYKKVSNTSTVDDSYKLVFAAKLGSNMPADHYKANIYVSAVGNAAATANLGFTGAGKTIYTMQEMTNEICAGGTLEAQSRLIDTRDGKLYWVAKLKDGNCWMTQNLDFDVPEKLSNTTSDVPKVITSEVERASIASWPKDGNIYRGYYDPGQLFYSYSGHGQVPSNTCTNVSSFDVEGCASYFTPVTASTNPADLHYHVGNYYSYPAATVGQMDGKTTGSATMSICPKGWTLPSAGNSSMYFDVMLASYGIAGSTNINRIYASPLYFVYTGLIGSNGFYGGGYQGYYWSATVLSDKNYAYRLGFADQIFSYNSYSYGRFQGMSVRCVAK